MTSIRANSSPTLLPTTQRHDLIMEGVAANVKLLLKMIDDYNHSPRGSDGRKPQRVAGMIGILDDIKSRIEKSQASAVRRKAELRRCNTDLRRAPAPPPSSSAIPSSSSSGSPKRVVEPVTEENEKLKKELPASHAARKSLQRMFSSLGKEKEIMAAELARKAHELNEMEELLNDLRAQNEMLSEKVKLCASEHRNRPASTGPAESEEELRERNNELGQKLLQSLDAYRALKRRYRDLLEETAHIRRRSARVADRLCKLRDRVADRGAADPTDLVDELNNIGQLFQQRLVSSGTAGTSG